MRRLLASACGLAVIWLGGCSVVPPSSARATAPIQMPIQAFRVARLDGEERPVTSAGDLSWNLAQIGHPGRFGRSLGLRPIVVAVLDTGVDLTHPQLAGRLYPVLDLVGSDLCHEGEAVTDFRGRDGNGHGTHVAGIVCQVAAGAQVRILPIKVIPNGGVGDDQRLSDGIERALRWSDAGDPTLRVRILNLSVSSPQVSERLRRAIRKASDQGLLIVAASGNEGKSVDFPASMPEVLTVGATTHNGLVAPYSCFGDSVDLVAPGGSETGPIVSSWPTYLTSSDLAGGLTKTHSTAGLVGTSMAAPHVSAMAAVLWSLHPQLEAAQVRAGLLALADDLGRLGPDPYYGFGRLNTLRAMGGDRHDAH